MTKTDVVAMLNFDEARFLAIQAGAVKLAPRIHDVVRDRLAAGCENVFFVGTGGAGILMGPAVLLLEERSGFPVHHRMAAELVLRPPVQLGERSLVVIPSLSGTTPESIEALRVARSRGATVVSLTGDAGSALAHEADISLVNHAADDTSCESFYLQSLFFALSLLDLRQECDEYEQVVAELSRLPEVLLEAKRAFEPRAGSFAARIAGGAFHIITGAGSTWPEAFYYGMCILEEMQWIRTRPVHASDFFHGTLELVEAGVPVITLKGEDDSRALVERVEDFAQRYTDSAWTLDTVDVALPGLSPSTRKLVSPVVLATLLERVSAHLEVLREHPLSTRRYYKRVPY